VETDARDVTTVVYGEQRRGKPRAVIMQRQVPGSGWSRARTLAADGYPVELEVDRAGDALVVFRTRARRLDAVTRPVGGGWRGPRTLTPPGAHIDSFDAAMNGAGNTLVTWVRGNGDVEAVRKDPGRPWTRPDLLAPAGGPFVSAAIDEDADALVVWGYFAVEAAVQAAGSGWSEPATVARNQDGVVEVLDTATGRDGGFLVLSKKEDTALRVRDVVPAPTSESR
jgi:hypothetical protein